MTYKVKSNTSDHYSKRKSNIFQESPLTKRIATKHKPLLISATYHKVDQTRDKFPGCISLVSISFVKRISSFLRFTDFLIVAYSAKFKSKSLCKISKWELSRLPKATKHRYANTILYFSYKYKTVDSKIQHRG